jgi:hypothetical protein
MLSFRMWKKRGIFSIEKYYGAFNRGTCRVWNEIKTERNQTKQTETDRNETKSNETKSGKIFDIFRPEKENCSMKT